MTPDENDDAARLAVAVAELAGAVAGLALKRLDAAEKAAAPDPREVAAFIIADDGAVSIEFVTGDVVRFACESQARATLDAAALGGAAAARPGARLRRCDYTADDGRRRSFYAEIAE